MDIAKFIEEIKAMTVVELNDLVKAIETEFGVSAAAPVAVAAAGAAPAAAVEEKTEFKVTLKGALYYTTNLGTDVFGNILRLDNLLESMEERINTCREQLENTRMQLENAKLEVDKPFPQEDELKRKSARLDELNILLNMDKRESEIVDGDVGDEVTAPARGSPDRER